MRKKVVVFGGGTGISVLLRGLKNFPVDITAIITVSDNGSSTGKLREEFFMPAMGDIRNVIVNLSDADDKIKEIADYITLSNNEDGVGVVLDRLYNELTK